MFAFLLLLLLLIFHFPFVSVCVCEGSASARIAFYFRIRRCMALREEQSQWLPEMASFTLTLHTFGHFIILSHKFQGQTSHASCQLPVARCRSPLLSILLLLLLFLLSIVVTVAARKGKKDTSPLLAPAWVSLLRFLLVTTVMPTT